MTWKFGKCGCMRAIKCGKRWSRRNPELRANSSDHHRDEQVGRRGWEDLLTMTFTDDAAICYGGRGGGGGQQMRPWKSGGHD